MRFRTVLIAAAVPIVLVALPPVRGAILERRDALWAKRHSQQREVRSAVQSQVRASIDSALDGALPEVVPTGQESGSAGADSAAAAADSSSWQRWWGRITAIFAPPPPRIDTLALPTDLRDTTLGLRPGERVFRPSGQIDTVRSADTARASGVVK